MKILSINSGSASLKFKLFEMPEEKVLVSGIFDRIGKEDSFYVINNNKVHKEISNYTEVINILMVELIKMNVIASKEEIKAIGHRIVHGGPHFTKSEFINDEVIAEIERCISFAPLHNGAHLQGIRAFMEMLPQTSNVAVFDTAFNQTIDLENYLYAVPYEWYEKYYIRKYGFHGISYNYLTNRMSEILGKKDIKLILCHLGNGASLAAVKNGKVVASSMGFSPSTGLIMGNRAGEFDFTAIPYLMKEADMGVEEVVYNLNYKSGLLGISGISNDMRDIEEEISKNNPRALLAQDMFVNKIVSYIAQYYVQLEGIDALCFSAGIGENSSNLRKKILDKLKILGIVINEDKNKINGSETLISDDNSQIPVYVLPTNEEIMIARDTYNLIK